MGNIFDPGYMLSTVPQILPYLPLTLGLALLSAGLGLVIGFLVALVRYFHVRFLSVLCKIYVSFIRGTPMLVQLFLVYYGTPILLEGINTQWGTAFNVNGIPRLVFAAFAFSMNCGAYMSETIRSAMLSVDAGQLEACYSVNMTTRQAMMRIILPQAFTVALPPLGNSLISMVKETSLAFSISVVDMMAQAKLVGSRSFRFFEIYVVVSFLYWGVCIFIEQALSFIEKRMRRYERRLAK
jgi:His/Glu/Gln/Arg/opine family amino acid ABC transporter permease subunit